MVGRCGSCHRVHALRLVVLEFAVKGGGSRHCEARLCGGCTAALLDSIEVRQLAEQQALPYTSYASLEGRDSL
jgi:hypothetical protein